MRCEVLVKLGKCQPLRADMLTLLARCLAHFGSVLRQIAEHRKLCQPAACENMYYIFDCMEQLLRDVCACNNLSRGDMTSGTSARAAHKPDLEPDRSSETARVNPASSTDQQQTIGQVCVATGSKAAQGGHFLCSSQQKKAQYLPHNNTTPNKADCSIPQEVIDTINIQLEDSLVLITDFFPCFAFAVWHLKGLLEQVSQKNND